MRRPSIAATHTLVRIVVEGHSSGSVQARVDASIRIAVAKLEDELVFPAIGTKEGDGDGGLLVDQNRS